MLYIVCNNTDHVEGNDEYIVLSESLTLSDRRILSSDVNTHTEPCPSSNLTDYEMLKIQLLLKLHITNKADNPILDVYLLVFIYLLS